MLNNGNIVFGFFRFATYQSLPTPGRLIKRYSLSFRKNPTSTRFLRILEKGLPKNIGILPFEEAGVLYTSISAFQTKIANANLVLILLSDEYFESLYCLTELLFTFIVRTGGLYNWMSDSQGHTDMSTDMEGVIPVVLTELKTTRTRCTKYWESEASAFAQRIKDGSFYTECDTYGDAIRPLMMARSSNRF